MGSGARVTLADVAKAAGVDVSLVSRVLRGETVRLREETRARIRHHADTLGYRPNAIARSLRSSHAGAWGLIIPDFTNPVFAQIIAGAETAAAKRNSVMMTASGAGWDRAQWYEALDGGRVDGLLIAGGSAIDLSSLRVPYILVNRTFGGVERYVVLDDRKAGQMAVEHLMTLGHRDIVFLDGPPVADTATRRREGYRTALAAAGVTLHPELEVQGDYTASGGRDALRAGIDSGMEFTAVVAANLPSALGALEALRDAGLSVPQDVSVVAIHDAEIADFVYPRLTTVRMPLTELGARAIELISTTSATDTITEVVAEPMDLVVRESTGPVR
ncbi:LacI family DNA-binding transcriptional regulator [soil metagenome]